MTYTKVGFNESFQEWARSNKLVCECPKPTHLPDEHVTACPMAAAFAHWQESSRKLYAAMPKTVQPSATEN